MLHVHNCCFNFLSDNSEIIFDFVCKALKNDTTEKRIFILPHPENIPKHTTNQFEINKGKECYSQCTENTL
ncbi:MAG: hypothetical protein WCQ95_09090, partial [Bacteroidota bacterium]